ncbi:MAG: TIGR00282 family metallophosphoesterase [Victivallaceae bacterium]|nr:TIGR00282 family metallophosphoesterase [Victivallaceae bacterium]
MNLIFIGDVVGSGGRKAVKKLLPELKREFSAQVAVVNAENSAAGNGLTGKCLAEMSPEADVFTAGDHVWDQKGFEFEIDRIPNVLRPANLHHVQPGRSWAIFRNPGGGDYAVIALMGKVFMRDSAYCPFETADRLVEEIAPKTPNIFIDFHAEATSEKLAMSYFLDGRVTAVVGTHTHVQTSDAEVLPGGTAHLTDLGMAGAARSVLGRKVEDVLTKFTTGMPCRLAVAEDGPIRVCGAVITYDYRSGRATKIVPIDRMVEL